MLRDSSAKRNNALLAPAFQEKGWFTLPFKIKNLPMLRSPNTKRTHAPLTPAFLEKDWFTLPLKIVARPSVIIGEGGSGKTESLLKIAYLLAKMYGFDIIYVDAKGDDDLAPRFVDTMRKAGKQ
jgi:hypothetical protein